MLSSYGARLGTARLQAGIKNPTQLARILDVCHPTAGAWERGLHRPDRDVEMRLVEELGVNRDYLDGVRGADMLHPTCRLAFTQLREHLRSHVDENSNPAKMAVRFLIQFEPGIFSSERLCRRLGCQLSQVMSGFLSAAALDRLSMWTGIRREFWDTADLSLLGPPDINAELVQLHEALHSTDPPIPMHIVIQEIPYLLSKTKRSMELNETGPS